MATADKLRLQILKADNRNRALRVRNIPWVIALILLSFTNIYIEPLLVVIFITIAVFWQFI